MKNKTLLIHIKSEESLKDFVELLRKPHLADKINYSMEIKAMVKEFVENEWDCYLATISNFNLEEGIYHQVYSLKTDEFYDLSLADINDKIPVMILRNTGPMEPNFIKLQNYLNYMIKYYRGRIINNPKAMLKGMTKHYLAEIESEALEKLNIKTIPTKVFDKNISYNELINVYPAHQESYLIKPLAGELSNSLKCLKDVNEEFLRYKENKIQGWVVQPIQEEIWNGEYQVVFLGNEAIYSQLKSYVRDNEEIPSQKKRILKEYTPSSIEIESLKGLITYMEKFYNISIDICRIDFMKDENNNLILLEFEMVNPGFFIAYQDENSDAIKKIVKSIRIYCEKII